MIDRLVATPLCQLWPKEATDFTPWLAANIDLLGEALDMTLDEEPETEASVGGFRADLVAVNDQGETVIIENFLKPADHGHLGQLITYAAGRGAAYAVLVAKSLRDEHRSALRWLNDISRDGFGFFGVEVAAWRIGDSPPAPQLNVVVEPDNWRRAVRAADSGLKATYREFWAGFLPRLHDVEPRWRGTKKPQRENWMQFRSAAPGVKYVVRFRPSVLTAQAYIDTGDDTTTSELYDWLHERRPDIEAAFGAELSWNRLAGRRASVINTDYPNDVNIEDGDTWPTLWEWLAATMGRLANAIDPVLDRY